MANGKTVADAEEEIRKSKADYFRAVQFPNRRATSLTQEEKELVKVFKEQYMLTIEERRDARTKATKEVYAKCILFDYSYKYFYADGYGKESLILNMDSEAYAFAENAQKYFTACILSYYQQMWLWATSHGQLTEFNLEKPLWVFVGNKVKGEDSDVLEVVNFLAFFLNKDDKVKAWLADLIADKAQILDAKKNNIFHNRFTPLMGFLGRIDDLYADVLQRVFNAPSRQRLKLVNIRASKGELALRVGDAEPFGLINIGDDAGFFSTAENATAFDNETDEFGGALFGTLNNKDSKLNVLIGSKKFTEGWSSWRVSTMGLLNMGQGEGSQIIQLFGRGVRLKGKGFSLKRSTPHERPKGLNLELLETLNIFGVRANYMNTFKDYLVEEGIVPFDEILELDFETRANLPASQLKTLALKDGYKDNQKLGFKRTHYPVLYVVPDQFVDKIKPAHVVLDLYPRVAAMATKDRTLKNTEAREQGKLNSQLFTLFDWDRIYLAVMRFKLQRSWSNLRLDMQKLRDFAEGPSTWYTLFVPSRVCASKKSGPINWLVHVAGACLMSWIFDAPAIRLSWNCWRMSPQCRDNF